MKNWIFDDPFQKKGPVLVIWVIGMIQPWGWIKFWGNEAVEVIEATEAVEVIEAAEILRPGKSLLRTSESSGFLNSNSFWCFENISILIVSWNIIFQFLNLFCLKLLRPAYITFLKIGSINQNFHISGFQNYLQL